uniref:AAA+ ATPase domain-containing protein n=1 Tax=Arcella intermedia TaxID=1963864 RepID=A0A6B2L8S5_9EUKA
MDPPERLFLSDKLVSQQQLDNIISHVGEFGPDQRAGIDGCLHRISAMRAINGDIYGLTLRVGRSVVGLSEIISDLLYDCKLSGKSFLILGGPGTGKTTIIREITRILSGPLNLNVVVVDTSNEICGDGDVPHESVGLGRRMMVPSIGEQERVMIECLQNHTPEVLVIDEIGRKKEVLAAMTVKQRGVQIVASAHGNLVDLVKNKALNGLVGGVEAVLLGDEAARENFGRKIKEQRVAEPLFEVVIELKKGDLAQWNIYTNLSQTVDAILDGRSYSYQVRTRDTIGRVWVEYYHKRGDH